MIWIEIGEATPPEWMLWLGNNDLKHLRDWYWNDDSCGHYFICFERDEDAIAFKLRFEL